MVRMQSRVMMEMSQQGTAAMISVQSKMLTRALGLHQFASTGVEME